MGAGPSLIAAVVFLRPPMQGSWLRVVLDVMRWSMVPARLAYTFTIVLIGSVAGAVFMYGGLKQPD